MRGRSLVVLAAILVIAAVIAVVVFLARPGTPPGLEDERRACEAEGGEWVPDETSDIGFVCQGAE